MTLEEQRLVAMKRKEKEIWERRENGKETVTAFFFVGSLVTIFTRIYCMLPSFRFRLGGIYSEFKNHSTQLKRWKSNGFRLRDQNDVSSQKDEEGT